MTMRLLYKHHHTGKLTAVTASKPTSELAIILTLSENDMCRTSAIRKGVCNTAKPHRQSSKPMPIPPTSTIPYSHPHILFEIYRHPSQGTPFVVVPFITGLVASCFTGPSAAPPPGLSHVPPFPKGNSCITISLVLSLRPARC